MCYQPRHGASGDSCNAKDGNPFGPFWDTFNIDFDHSEYYGPLGFDTNIRAVAKKWHERLVVYPFTSIRKMSCFVYGMSVSMISQKVVKFGTVYNQLNLWAVPKICGSELY